MNRLQLNLGGHKRDRSALKKTCVRLRIRTFSVIVRSMVSRHGLRSCQARRAEPISRLSILLTISACQRSG